MRTKKLISFILAGVMAFSLVACNKQPTQVSPNGVIEDSETKEEDKTPVEQMPVYDYQNLPASNELSKEELSSYYARQLSDTNKQRYNEIYNAALNYQDEMIFDGQVSVETFRKLMNIIYLDTPELYMLDTKYDYDIGDNGNVSKVYLKYKMTREEYDSANEYFIKDISDKVSSFRSKNSEYEAEQEIFDKFNNNMYVSDQTAMSSYDAVRGKANQFGLAKLFVYYCRKTGIDSTVVVGELTNTELAKNIGLEISTYKPLNEVFKETVDGGKVSVEVDYSGFYIWPIIKLNDAWYHVDPLMIMLYEEYFGKQYNQSIENTKCLFNVDDYTISQSRLFYINESILGLLPACNSKIFQYQYRQGNYILNYNSNQLSIALSDRIENLIENKPGVDIYQFGSEDTYNLFLSKIDGLIEVYNESHDNIVQSYSIVENREMLTIFITNLICYDN